MKKEQGITLIALIITIIVMLILVAVTINVALNGGLFQKSSVAGTETQKQADKEELMSAAFGTIDSQGNLHINKTDLEKVLSDGWSVNDTNSITDGNGETWYPCTSPRGVVYYLNIKTGKIQENEPEPNGGGTEDLEYLRGIFIEKTVDDNTETGICADSNCDSLKADLKALGIDDSYFNVADGVKIIVYKGVAYYLAPGTAGAQISEVNYLPESDEDDSGYFEISIEDENNRTLIITGLADDGEDDIETNHVLTIPDTLTVNGEIYTVIGLEDHAFNRNTDINSVIFDGTHITIIGDNAFADCTALAGKITIPSSVITIVSGAFSNTGITELSLNGTNLTTIGDTAFGGCTALTGKITIPSSVTTIGNGAFSNTGITELDLRSNINLNTSDVYYPWGLDTSVIKFE